MLTGRIVDTYTNILTVKLFARAHHEDAYVRDAIEEHTGLFYNSLRLNTLFSFCLSTLNAMLVTARGPSAALTTSLCARASSEPLNSTAPFTTISGVYTLSRPKGRP